MGANFGEYIRKLRICKGFTLTQLAARLHLDSANLCKIENGKREFNEKKLGDLANVLEEDINKIKIEYFGCLFAKKIYDSRCSKEALNVAELKINYLNKIDLTHNIQNEE